MVREFKRGMLRSGLTLACPSDGRAGSIRLNQDADLFIGWRDYRETVVHPLGEARHAMIQVIEGDPHLTTLAR